MTLLPDDSLKGETMPIHNSSRHHSPIINGASPRASLRWRVAAAFQVLVHGAPEPQSDERPLDPLIVAGIDRHADAVAEAFDDPLAGAFARDILTESAHLIIDSFGVPAREAKGQSVATEATADHLVRGRREPT